MNSPAPCLLLISHLHYVCLFYRCFSPVQQTVGFCSLIYDDSLPLLDDFNPFTLNWLLDLCFSPFMVFVSLALSPSSFKSALCPLVKRRGLGDHLFRLSPFTGEENETQGRGSHLLKSSVCNQLLHHKGPALFFCGLDPCGSLRKCVFLSS